jgi:hypothetical protein
LASREKNPHPLSPRWDKSSNDYIDSTENATDSLIPLVESTKVEIVIKLWDVWDRPQDVFPARLFEANFMGFPSANEKREFTIYPASLTPHCKEKKEEGLAAL